jgi:hypothetical protein
MQRREALPQLEPGSKAPASVGARTAVRASVQARRVHDAAGVAPRQSRPALGAVGAAGAAPNGYDRSPVGCGGSSRAGPVWIVFMIRAYIHLGTILCRPGWVGPGKPRDRREGPTRGRIGNEHTRCRQTNGSVRASHPVPGATDTFRNVPRGRPTSAERGKGWRRSR